jgi:hypothetical protein
MRNPIRVSTLACVLALAACGGGDGGDDGTLSLVASAGQGQDVVLGLDETARVGTLSLEFTEVIDSRCGVGSAAVCVWEGNAEVFVTATNGQLSQVLTLNSNSKFPISAVFAGHLIVLRRLDPQPTYTNAPIGEYTATLSVEAP